MEFIKRLLGRSDKSGEIDPEQEQRKFIITAAIIVLMQMITVVAGWIYFERVIDRLAQIWGAVN